MNRRDTVKAFDFDNTIYQGESSVDFAFFALRKNKRILLYLPSLLWNAVMYRLCLVSRDKLEKRINNAVQFIFRDKNEIISLTAGFWERNYHKLDSRMLKRINDDDIIITAGPSFLISAIADRLGTSNLLCTEVDWDKMKISFFNFGENKVRRYRELYGDEPVDCFYTDSYNDRSMMDISERVFLVKNGRIKSIK